MPEFRYISMTLDGKFQYGTMTAKDKDELVWNLSAQHYFLVWWSDVDPSKPPTPIPPDLARHLILPESVPAVVPEAVPAVVPEVVQTVVPEVVPQRHEEIPMAWNQNLPMDLLGRISGLTGGAVQSEAQAIILFVTLMVLTIGTACNVWHSLQPKSPAVSSEMQARSYKLDRLRMMRGMPPAHHRHRD